MSANPLATAFGASSDPTENSHVTIQKIHCFKDSLKTTGDYLSDKDIRTISLSDFYAGRNQFPKGSFIIISADGLDQTYPAPSPKLIPPHLQAARGDLVARILSEHIHSESVQIGSGFVTQHQSKIIVIMFTLVSLGYIFGLEWLGLLISLVAFVAAITLSQRYSDNYEIPGILISFFPILFAIFTLSNLIIDKLRRNLSKNIAFNTLNALLKAETVGEIDQTIFQVGKRYLIDVSRLGFFHDKPSYQAFAIESLPPTKLRHLQKFFDITDRSSTSMISRTLSEIRSNAIEQAVMRQKHHEQQLVIVENQAKSAIMSKFLANSLISKISREKDFYHALKQMIKPSYEWVAILQADIRGFSNLTASHPPEQVVKLLKGYFQETVDFAQDFAQIKLIGDAIFLFSIAKDVEHASNQVLKAAIQLIRSTDHQNKTNESGAKIRFGIALNFGQLVVGNLSSDDCIDFTIIGNDVNKTARLEEMTKNSSIADIIGENSLIVTREFYNSLKDGETFPFKWIDLPSLGVSVRSFSDIKEVGYLKVET